jgi:hypothetical protein
MGEIVTGLEPFSVPCTGASAPAAGTVKTSRPALVARYRKFAVAAAGAVAGIVSLNLVHGTAQTWLVGLLAAASALGVYATPNATSVTAAPPGVVDAPPAPAAQPGI